MDKKLAQIAETLKKGGDLPPVTVRDFLGWFGAQRRGYWIVYQIRQKLKQAELRTVPDFEGTYIDAPITFALIKAEPAKAKTAKAANATPEVPVAPPEESIAPASQDPTYRISKLAAANQQIVSVKPDGSLAEAVTIMLSRDFSQLPVMTTEREVKGVVSWRSIGARLALGNSGATAKDFMEPHQEIRASSSLFEAIPIIVDKEYVLVRADDGRVSGIITASDLSLQFRALTEPFLLLAEIENLVRGMIAKRFSAPELEEVRDPSDGDRKIESVADLTFGEYVRLLEKPERWTQFGLSIDRLTFCRDLDHVRRIRNDVMHFDPDGIPQEDLDRLREFASFLKQLQVLSA